jgi:hypothetical protein
MAQQLRVYTMKEGRLEDWVSLWTEKVAPLRRRFGFEVTGYRVSEKSQFVWILDWPGTRDEFESADAAYYAQPEHPPLHAKGVEWIDSAQSSFLEPVE